MLAGGAAIIATGATGGAAAAILRTRGGASRASTLTPTGFTPVPASTPTATPAPAIPRGGTATVAAPVSFSFDTFDVQRSGQPSVIEVLGRTHSRLFEWTDFDSPTLGGDLAESWEQPDPQTLILHLDGRARWQDRAPLDGRALTAADVVAHFRRTLSLVDGGKLPVAQRSRDYEVIRRVSSPGPGTVVFETATPDPFLLQTLAGRFALVQAPETVQAFESRDELRIEDVVGAGPFVYEGLDDGTVSLAAFRLGHRQPYLDRLRIREPARDLDPFRRGEAGEFLAFDRRDAASLRESPGAAVLELPRLEDSPVITSCFAGAPPWNNPALLRAITAALNRGELAQRLFGGRAVAFGLVTPATPTFALSEAELTSFDGYRGDSAEDALQAKTLWTAGGGPALGPITVDFPSIFDPLYSASSVVTGMLNETLGAQFRAAVETYTTIAAKVQSRRYGNGRAALWFGWGPPLAGPDPSPWLIETFDPRSVDGRALGVPSGEFESRLDALSVEFDIAPRRRIAREVSRRVLSGEGGGLLTWLVQRNELFRWPRLHRAAPSPFWPQHFDFATYRSERNEQG